MDNGVPPYPFFSPNQAYEQPAYYQPQPIAPVQQEVQVQLICDCCKEPIGEGEECINGLYGVAGKGAKSGRPMVVATKDIPEGEFNIHLTCIPMFIEDNLPEAADEIRQMSYEPQETEELFCANCDAKIEDENVG